MVIKSEIEEVLSARCPILSDIVKTLEPCFIKPHLILSVSSLGNVGDESLQELKLTVIRKNALSPLPYPTSLTSLSGDWVFNLAGGFP